MYISEKNNSVQCGICTINHKIFVVKIISDSMGNAKMRIINANVVQAHLSENYLTLKFITQNIHNLPVVYWIITLYCKSGKFHCHSR